MIALFGSELLFYKLKSVSKHYKEFNFQVSSEEIVRWLRFLRCSQLYQMRSLLDLWSVDFLGRFASTRFQLNYCLLSTFNAHRLFLSFLLSSDALAESVSKLFPAAFWLEREVWDMMGIFFKNNTDLRRILTDYGFVGFPLRKDFPLTGFEEVRYDDSAKRVLSESLSFLQEFRVFDFITPWDLPLSPVQ